MLARESSVLRESWHVYFRCLLMKTTASYTTIFALITYLMAANAVADILDDTDQLLDWAEASYPHWFEPDGGATIEWNQWLYRFYPATQNYAGVNVDDLHVYALGDAFGGLTDFGPIADVLAFAQANPAAYPYGDVDRLLDWAESTYPDLFDSARERTREQDEWLYRYYPSTENYVGVNRNDLRVYVFGESFTGLTDVGSMEETYAFAEANPAEYPVVATLVGAFKTVEVRSKHGDWIKAEQGYQIRKGDEIRTGPKGRARIEFADRYQELNAGPSVLNVGSDSQVAIDRFLVNRDLDNAKRDGLVDIFKGWIRAWSKGWGGQSTFSVRTGTSLCGIRGTDVVLNYEPSTDVATYMVDHGLMVCPVNQGAESVELTESEKVTFVAGEPGLVEPLDPDEFDAAAALTSATPEEDCLAIGRVWDGESCLVPHICSDESVPYDSRAEPCARFWGCSGVYPGKGDYLCPYWGYYDLRGDAVTEYSCEDSARLQCTQTNSWDSVTDVYPDRTIVSYNLSATYVPYFRIKPY